MTPASRRRALEHAAATGSAVVVTTAAGLIRDVVMALVAWAADRPARRRVSRKPPGAERPGRGPDEMCMRG